MAHSQVIAAHFLPHSLLQLNWVAGPPTQASTGLLTPPQSYNNQQVGTTCHLPPPAFSLSFLSWLVQGPSRKSGQVRLPSPVSQAVITSRSSRLNHSPPPFHSFPGKITDRLSYPTGPLSAPATKDDPRSPLSSHRDRPNVPFPLFRTPSPLITASAVLAEA